jgi:hypothetical protein
MKIPYQAQLALFARNKTGDAQVALSRTVVKRLWLSILVKVFFKKLKLG